MKTGFVVKGKFNFSYDIKTEKPDLVIDAGNIKKRKKWGT